jgi:hypothetical protein
LTLSGRKIGVELGEWLHQKEMNAGKLASGLSSKFLMPSVNSR